MVFPLTIIPCSNQPEELLSPGQYSCKPKGAKELNQKALNWIKGLGWKTNAESKKEISQVKAYLDTLSPEQRDKYLQESYLNCELPGGKSGLGCIQNLQGLIEGVLTGGSAKLAPKP